MRAARQLAEKGTTPPGVDITHQRVRSASLVLPPDRPFKDAEQEALVTRPGMAPATV
jgi:phthalate 4,5-dioxygenase